MNSDVKILFFDIETSPVLAWIWKTGSRVRITHEQIKKGMKNDIICICWKWNNSRKVHSLDWGIKEQNSSKMIDAFSKEIEKADIVIAHNGKNFDIKHINTQRLLHNQKPIAWPTLEDSLAQCRTHFYLPSYKLDFLGSLLTSSGKDKMHFSDWIDIVQDKKPKALAKMIKYCKKDVLLLESVFNRTKTFFKPKVNVGLILRNERYACHRCGSKEVIRHGVRRTLAKVYQRLQCCSCGSIFIGPAI